VTDERPPKLARSGFFQAFFCMAAFGTIDDTAVAAFMRNRLFGYILFHMRTRRMARRLQ